jgi:spore coat polysaccharide biosynthesis protein SpsF (cytidylyltransferase family)
MEPMFPDGFDVEVFKSWLLGEANRRSEYREDREHVTPWIKRFAERKGIVPCPSELLPWKDVKLSVDTMEDYERVIKFYKENPCKLY